MRVSGCGGRAGECACQCRGEYISVVTYVPLSLQSLLRPHAPVSIAMPDCSHAFAIIAFWTYVVCNDTYQTGCKI